MPALTLRGATLPTHCQPNPAEAFEINLPRHPLVAEFGGFGLQHCLEALDRWRSHTALEHMTFKRSRRTNRCGRTQRDELDIPT